MKSPSSSTEISSITNSNTSDISSSTLNNSAEINTTETKCSIWALLDRFKANRQKRIEYAVETDNCEDENSNGKVETLSLESVDQDLSDLKKLSEAFMPPGFINSEIKNLCDRLNELRGKPGATKELRELSQKVGDLKSQIHAVPNLYTEFEYSSTFKDFEVQFDSLSMDLKLCFLCFSLFPENAIIKRRLMIYWWIGEGFIPPMSSEKAQTAEDFGNDFFEELMAKGFIEPAVKTKVDRCRMRPLVRLAVIKVAKRANFFNFDRDGNPTAEFSASFRACLMGEGLKTGGQDLGTLHMLFNFNEPYFNFKPELLWKMKNINLLFLGGWQVIAPHYTELENSNFLDGLKKNKYLRVLSLRGIFGIKRLPDSISSLVNLLVLDLRACHNLELVPIKIGSLRCLTHLDMSECYLLDHMPKELKCLTQLQVLKGFVVVPDDSTDCCTFEDLKELKCLRKLSVFIVCGSSSVLPGRFDFQIFPKLSKLTIEWEYSQMQIGNTREKMKFSSQLQKLDLRCFPGTNAVDWLDHASLTGLKRLYFRGGKLGSLNHDQTRDPKTWTAEILRLKHLKQLEMDWRQLKSLFPHLRYLEAVNCPKLTFFPCDATGVWMKR